MGILKKEERKQKIGVKKQEKLIGEIKLSLENHEFNE